MGNRATIDDVVHGEIADIQFEDEGGESVGVENVTVRFLERFTGHVSPFQFQFISHQTQSVSF